MPTNGMTIDSLNTVSSLTAQDEVPVWDKEASGEHTRKITAQNMANSVKSLASLPNTTEMNAAIAQSKAKVVAEIVNISDLTFVQRDNWYRANASMQSVFGRTDIVFVQTVTWNNTNMPIITQIDSVNVQFIAPNMPSAGSVIVRGLII